MKPLNRGGRREQFQTERVLRALFAGCDDPRKILILSEFINAAVGAGFLPMSPETAMRVGRGASEHIKNLAKHDASKALVGADGKPLNG